MQAPENDLRRLREDAAISQRRMALFLGLSNTAVSKWEKAARHTPQRLLAYERAIRFLAKQGAA